MRNFPGYEEHEFKDCRCNPKSNNYCGKHLKDVWKEAKAKKELNAHEKEEENKTEDNEDTTTEHCSVSNKENRREQRASRIDHRYARQAR